MGSNHLISLKEAAELLGIGERTIHYHVRRGHLHPRYDKKQGLRSAMMFAREEIAAAAETWGEQPTFSGLMSRCVSAYALARSLESRVLRLEELIGAKYTSTPVDEEFVRSTYLAAKDDVKSPPTDPQRIAFWSNLFMSFGEEFFDALEGYTSHEKSWEVFHDLSCAIAIESIHVLKSDAEMTQVYQDFEVARRNLRQVLFFYLQSRFGTRNAVKMFEVDVAAHEKVLRFLSVPTTPDQSGPSNRTRTSRRSPW